METELTKRLKRLCHSYHPMISTTKRTICWAEEVPMSDGGIVDVIRFEDEYTFSHTFCKNRSTCAWPERMKKGCRGCTCVKRVYGPVRPLCTCFEVKITMQDFFSGHGHNFHGHLNYFVVPKEIQQEALEAVQKHYPTVGLLVASGRSLRCVRGCVRRHMTDTEILPLMYAAFKKQMH